MRGAPRITAWHIGKLHFPCRPESGHGSQVPHGVLCSKTAALTHRVETDFTGGRTAVPSGVRLAESEPSSAAARVTVGKLCTRPCTTGLVTTQHSPRAAGMAERAAPVMCLHRASFSPSFLLPFSFPKRPELDSSGDTVCWSPGTCDEC